MIHVELQKVTKRFDNVVAVDGLDLTVSAGEFMVVVGPSGAGKTTLLRLVAGLEKPDAGDIYVDGYWSNDIPAGKRPVQLIFQSYALWPHMKVYDDEEYSNLSLPLRLRNLNRQEIRRRVQAIADRVRLPAKLFPRKPGTLSGGEQQRVALSRALTTSPRVLLMDEPIASLDPPTRVRVRWEIKELQREQQMTTIYVTHDIGDALVLADRIAVMREGKVVQVGTEQQLRTHPRDPFVTWFLFQ